MAEKGKQLKVGDRVSDSFGRKGTVVRFGKHGAVAVKWDKKTKKGSGDLNPQPVMCYNSSVSFNNLSLWLKKLVLRRNGIMAAHKLSSPKG